MKGCANAILMVAYMAQCSKIIKKMQCLKLPQKLKSSVFEEKFQAENKKNSI